LNVVLRPEAESDVAAAYQYYDQAGPDLIGQFIDELDRLLLRLSAFPRSAQPVEGYDAVRRALLRRSPFAVSYIAGDGEVVVLRVIHTARSQDEPGTDERP
jgi:plasmid stabilization system protein ParE